jgi:hypothetical protein
LVYLDFMDPPSRERSETKTGIAPVYIGIAKKLLLAQLQKSPSSSFPRVEVREICPLRVP